MRDCHPLCSTFHQPSAPNCYARLFISCLHTCIPQSGISACGGKSLSAWSYITIAVSRFFRLPYLLPCIYIIAPIWFGVNIFLIFFREPFPHGRFSYWLCGRLCCPLRKCGLSLSTACRVRCPCSYRGRKF